jgi:hypothetical protein
MAGPLGDAMGDLGMVGQAGSGQILEGELFGPGEVMAITSGGVITLDRGFLAKMLAWSTANYHDAYCHLLFILAHESAHQAGFVGPKAEKPAMEFSFEYICSVVAPDCCGKADNVARYIGWSMASAVDYVNDTYDTTNWPVWLIIRTAFTLVDATGRGKRGATLGPPPPPGVLDGLPTVWYFEHNSPFPGIGSFQSRFLQVGRYAIAGTNQLMRFGGGGMSTMGITPTSASPVGIHALPRPADSTDHVIFGDRGKKLRAIE